MSSLKKLLEALGLAIMTTFVSSCAAPAEIMTYADFLELQQPPAPRTISYGTDPLQHVELWMPDGTGPFPVALMIHGGCWQTEIAKAGIMHLLAERLKSKGVAVWNVEYRGVDVPGGGYPGTFEDIADAADLLAEIGQREGLALEQSVAIGHSAGGHLALWLAGRQNIAPDSPLHADYSLRLRAVISVGGLPDLQEVRDSPGNICGMGIIDRLIGPATARHPDPLSDTSPVSLLPLGIKQLLVSGDADPIAPPKVAASYVAKAKAAGDEADSRTMARQGHFELITPETPAGEEVVNAVLDALKEPER